MYISQKGVWILVPVVDMRRHGNVQKKRGLLRRITLLWILLITTCSCKIYTINGVWILVPVMDMRHGSMKKKRRLLLRITFLWILRSTTCSCKIIQWKESEYSFLPCTWDTAVRTRWEDYYYALLYCESYSLLLVPARYVRLMEYEYSFLSCTWDTAVCTGREDYCYGVATISRLLKTTGLLWKETIFCKRDLSRDYILQKSPIISRSLLIVASPYTLLCCESSVYKKDPMMNRY